MRLHTGFYGHRKSLHGKLTLGRERERERESERERERERERDRARDRDRDRETERGHDVSVTTYRTPVQFESMMNF